MLEQNSHYQTHQRKCNFFYYRTFEIVKFASTTNIPIIIGNENTALKAPPGNRKVNKSVKAKEKVMLVGDSIVSGINGKGLSADKFTNVVYDIPGAG